MKNRFNRTLAQCLTTGVVALVLSISSATMAAAQEKKDIVDTAVAVGSFQTLAKALDAAGLVETLKGAGPFTVFAPTDEAFAKLPAGTLEELLKPENKGQAHRDSHLPRRAREGAGFTSGQAELRQNCKRAGPHYYYGRWRSYGE